MPATAALDPSDLFHTGFMVPDLPAAMQQLAAVAGHRFTRPIDGDIPISTRNGPLRLQVRFVYSLTAPHLELIQQIPGTPWMPAPGNAAHHFGYFCDGVPATVQRMQQLGFELEANGLDETGGVAMFAFLIDPSGLRIEVVERSGMPDFPAMLAALTPTAD